VQRAAVGDNSFVIVAKDVFDQSCVSGSDETFEVTISGGVSDVAVTAVEHLGGAKHRVTYVVAPPDASGALADVPAAHLALASLRIAVKVDDGHGHMYIRETGDGDERGAAPRGGAMRHSLARLPPPSAMGQQSTYGHAPRHVKGSPFEIPLVLSTPEASSALVLAAAQQREGAAARSVRAATGAGDGDGRAAALALTDGSMGSTVSSLCTVTYYANRAHSLTRSP
jgi:hypothetical protein